MEINRSNVKDIVSRLKQINLLLEKVETEKDCSEPLEILGRLVDDFVKWGADKYYLEKLNWIGDLVNSFSVWGGVQDDMTLEEVYEFGSFDLDGNVDGDGHEILEAINEIESLANDLEDEIDL